MSQLPLPHHSMKFVDSADFLSLPVCTKASYLVLERKVADLRCRGRVEGALEKDDRWWTRVLGISRRSRRALESRGLIRVDGAALVLVHYDVEAEVKASAFRERQRRLGQAGAVARWGGQEPEEIPVGIPAGSLELNLRNHSFDAMASANGLGQWPVEQISLRSADPLGSDQIHPDPDPVEEPAPSAAPSGLKRVAAASRPLVANRILRRRKVGPAPAPPSPARLSARTAPIPRNVRGSPRPRPETAKPGGAAGPDFKLWYDRYRRLTGVFYRREDALHVWRDLAMDADERRALWVFTDVKARTYSRDFKAPNPAEFLRVVWQLELRSRRALFRSGEPIESGDLVAAVIKRLKT